MRDVTYLEKYHDFVDDMRTFNPNHVFTPQQMELFWAVSGLSSEAGEVSGEIEKMMRKGEPIETREEKVFDEVSDCLFYCCAVLSALGRNADECFEHNMVKLRARHG
jgi:NTP pyrophosphatase (non-canonical NTP hydrolase)